MNEQNKYCDTSPAVIELLVSRLDLEFVHEENISILESSSGTGKIIEAMLKLDKIKPEYIHFCELDAKRASQSSETKAKFVDYDFLKYSTVNKYKRVISVCPFSDWLNHTTKMYEHLKVGGKQISLLPNYSLNDIDFVKWLSDKCAKVEFIKECACSYECSTFILEITK